MLHHTVPNRGCSCHMLAEESKPSPDIAFFVHLHTTLVPKLCYKHMCFTHSEYISAYAKYKCENPVLVYSPQYPFLL